jgi:acetate---CoA ligase (ADP-forming)
VLVDLLADSQCCLYPVTGRDASEMVEGLKGVRLLRGFRGAAVADVAAFREAILRISALVGICPEIQELDVNPLAVLPSGVSALDVRVRVSADHTPRDHATVQATSASGAMKSRSLA